MSVARIKKYQISCDHCPIIETVERIEKRGVFFSGGDPLPRNWKRTRWYYPRCSSAGQGGGSFDQCPECRASKTVDVPERACEVLTYIGDIGLVDRHDL
jgi:hypothetical protein